jgi:FkbM family methyltransferase
MIENIYDQIDTIENKAFDFLNKVDNVDVILFGSGKAAQWYIRFLKKYNIEPKCIIDNNKEKWGTLAYGIPVCCLDEAIQKYENYVIVISAPKFLREIKKQLIEKCGKERIFDFEAEIYYSYNYDISEYRKYVKDNWGSICNLYNKLQDDKSREVLEAFILGRLSADQEYFTNAMSEDQYYTSDLIHFTDNEVMVELGSNNGETLLQFLDKVDRKYNSVYCFEPDNVSIMQIKDIIEKEHGNIHLIEKGAWDKAAKLPFFSDSSSGGSHIVENDDNESYYILVDSIDNNVSGEITYVKMDIEGSELKALKGGEKSIIKYRPKLAICVYHNKEDLLDIVDYLESIVPEYKLFLRHHNWGATETVLYAII